MTSKVSKKAYYRCYNVNCCGHDKKYCDKMQNDCSATIIKDVDPRSYVDTSPLNRKVVIPMPITGIRIDEEYYPSNDTDVKPVSSIYISLA